MHIDQKVIVIVGGKRHQGIITRLPGKPPRNFSTGTNEWPYYGVTVLSFGDEPVMLYFLKEEMRTIEYPELLKCQQGELVPIEGDEIPIR